MTIGLLNIQPETFAQANPFLTGFQAGQQTINQGQLNQQQAMQNQALSQEVPYAGALTRAQLAQSQAQAPYTQAQTQNQLASAAQTGAQTNLLNQSMPSLVAQEQGKIFTDPIAQRAFEIGQASKDPQMSSVLSSMGLDPQQLVHHINAVTNAGAGLIPGVSRGQQNQINQGGLPSAGISPNQQQQGAMQPIGNLLPPQVQGQQGYTGDAAQNYVAFGTPYNPIQFKSMQAGAEQGAKSDADTYNQAIVGAQSQADTYHNLDNFMDQFQQGYKNSYYKGAVLGRVPTGGLESIPFRSKSNMAAEQQTDNAAQNASILNAKGLFGGRITNYEAQYAQNLKPSRAMTPETAQMTADFLRAKSARYQEYPAFLTAAKNAGVPWQTAQTLWDKYQNQRPVYNFQKKSSNDNFQNSFSDYLTPQAVSAAASGQNYVPLPQGMDPNSQKFKDYFVTLSPSDRKTVIAEIQQGGYGG